MELSYFALIGAPNCGKTVLFNGLTGSHAKVANYPGVTNAFFHSNLSFALPSEMPKSAFEASLSVLK